MQVISRWLWGAGPSFHRCRAAAACLATLVACDPAVAPKPTIAAEAPRISHPIGPGVEGESRNLLQSYAARPPIPESESGAWQLPFQSKRIAAAMLISAALDRPQDLAFILTPDATWGLPDRRRVGSRPIFDGDNGETFLAALRKTAQRFPGNATWTTQPVIVGLQESYRVGAEPMWNYWSQGDENLILSMVIVRGTARINYVGMWLDGPQLDIDTSAWGAPPPLIPKARTERIKLPE
ncbi:MAG: hypothetical protein JKY37_06485 [Nannocystaceae bacterium]|nr:hypothetical protein [Nannocystaceae bacterium]